MRHDLRDAVVVVTGASSGIGRATARAFTERGCRLVLAARREDRLDDVSAECRERGAKAITVPTDVADEAQMMNLADVALATYGRIDVWVNNAGVMMFGRFEETPSDDFRRLIETNFFGCVHGARAALPHFIRRGGGVLVNVASLASHVGQPYSAAYVASKYAVRGFSVALRQEMDDHPGVEVCTVSPSAIDTPLWQHTANYTGHAFRAFHPAYDARDVASAIVGLAERPRREVVVGAMGKAMAFQHRLLPGLTEKMMAFSTKKTVFKSERAPESPGALFRPVDDPHRVGGGWRVGPAHTARWVGAAAAAVPVGLMLYNLWQHNLWQRGAASPGPERRPLPARAREPESAS